MISVFRHRIKFHRNSNFLKLYFGILCLLSVCLHVCGVWGRKHEHVSPITVKAGRGPQIPWRCDRTQVLWNSHEPLNQWTISLTSEPTLLLHFSSSWYQGLFENFTTITSHNVTSPISLAIILFINSPVVTNLSHNPITKIYFRKSLPI